MENKQQVIQGLLSFDEKNHSTNILLYQIMTC